MKKRNLKKKPSGPKGNRKGKGQPIEEDHFFSQGLKKKRRTDDEIIDSGESEGDEDFFDSEANGAVADEGTDAVPPPETAQEKRLRMAKATVEKVKELAKRQREDEEEESDEDRDYLVAAQILEQEQMEHSGRARRAMAAKYCSFVLLPFSLQS